MILLNIQTSPRGSKSISTAATDAFVEAYRTAHPDVTVDNLNVWEEGLPEFDSEAIGAKYKGVSKEAMSDAESAIWKSIQSLAARFQAADLIVLGVPMWNFAYPYKLKQLIDLVCQRNFLFTFSEGKFGPLLKTAMPSLSTAEGRPMRNIHRHQPRCSTIKKVISTFGFTSSV